MATAHETVLQAARDWIRRVRGWTDIQAADLVIPVDRGAIKGPRPAIPFLAVDLATFGRTVGTDDKKKDATGLLTKGDRQGRLIVHGYGLETADWLEEIAMHVELTSSPLTVTSVGEIIGPLEVEGTNIAAHFVREFQIAYAVQDGPRPISEAVLVTGDVKYDPDDPSIIVPFNADLS